MCVICDKVIKSGTCRNTKNVEHRKQLERENLKSVEKSISVFF